MTETQGGSDLGANMTIARRESDGWRLFGEDKFFASNAGLADLAIVTARPEGAVSGPKGLALFLVPRETTSGELNFRIRRFKTKSATRAVPTGEAELHGSQASLIGKEELGIYYTLENLTISRLANAVGASGLARKAHLEALFRCKERSAFGKHLIQHPLIRYDLTDLAVRTAGSLALVFHAIQAFDRAWQEIPPYNRQVIQRRLSCEMNLLIVNKRYECAWQEITYGRFAKACIVRQPGFTNGGNAIWLLVAMGYMI